MIRILGIFFLLILIEVPILLVDHFIASGFLVEFLKNQSLSIMGVFLGFNIASCIFLIGYLTTIESQQNKILFKNSKGEMKQNLYLMLVVFVLHLFVLMLIPNINEHSSLLQRNIAQGCVIVGLFLFLVYIYALFEMTSVIFLIDQNIGSGKSK